MKTERPKMTHYDFGRLFRTKERETLTTPSGKIWDCYGTWDCSDISCQGDTEEKARIECYNYLLKNNLILTQQEDERRKSVLAAYASQAKPQRTTP